MRTGDRGVVVACAFVIVACGLAITCELGGRPPWAPSLPPVVSVVRPDGLSYDVYVPEGLDRASRSSFPS